MSWHFSQVLAAAYSADISSDGEQSVPSNGMPTHGTFWSPGKTTDVLKPSRSGMTFRPLTDDLGEAVLMSYLEAFPVRTFPVQERERESKENEAPCGNTWRESSAKFDLASSSWKTHQCLWEEDLPSSSLILPKWGMMRSGVLWERITPALLTSGTESGSLQSWPTPLANSGNGPGHQGRTGGVNLQTAASIWPTPQAIETGRSVDAWDAYNKTHRGELQKSLAVEAKRSAIWPTPCARDHKGPSARAYQGNPENLSDIALHGGEKWPTPCARDHKGVSGSGRQAKRGNPQDTLCNAVAGRMWPTPTASEVTKIPATANYGQKGLNNHPAIRGNPIREKMQKDRKGMDGGAKTQQTAGLAQLNPTWVEWLMGWPLGWTDCAASVTDKFQQWRNSHGKL